MPFEINYIVPGGGSYEKSFWRIANYSFDETNGSGIVIFFGYASVDAFNAGSPPIAQQPIIFNDSVIYDSYLRYWFITPDSRFSFHYYIEQAVLSTSDFFFGSVQYSPLIPRAIEIGAEANNRVNVTFPIGSDLTGIAAGDGVTIKINGVAATITGADVNLSISIGFGIYYDISPAAQIGDDVTWEYGGGTLTDPALLPLHIISAVAADNSVGDYLDFHVPDNSAHVVQLLV